MGSCSEDPEWERVAVETKSVYWTGALISHGGGVYAIPYPPSLIGLLMKPGNTRYCWSSLDPHYPPPSGGKTELPQEDARYSRLRKAAGPV